MRRTPKLSEGAEVHVDLGGAGGSIACTVLAFLGPLIVARHDHALPESTTERLGAGTTAYLLTELDGQMKALRGSARTAGPGLLALDISDEFRLGQRREWTRIPIALDARLKPLGIDADPIATTTLDVSPGGAQVRRPEGMRVWPRYELTLSGGPLASPVVGQVAPTRALPESLGLRFIHVSGAHLDALIHLVLTHAATGA